MTASAGRREANKQATRAALLAAAKRLFAERGFEATTIRDIAAEAQVTERTFYRYFDGKEGLIGDEYRAWLSILHEAILSRPPDEAPVVAVRQAMISIGQQVASGAGPIPLWLFSEGPPVTSLRRSAPRPLLQLESSIADAIMTRLRSAGDNAGRGDSGAAEDLRAKVISRVAVAALRSATIQYREQRAGGHSAAPGPLELLTAVFAIISEDWRA
ncbi:MAG TPA: helix-turn-helix domain-containing protein [Streptosporangiaceae bacterium]|nr:helix-turn-helix domain-containing protein [Streptosporangiaceae bacterium]